MIKFRCIVRNSMQLALLTFAIVGYAQESEVNYKPIKYKAPTADEVVKYIYPEDTYFKSFDTGEIMNGFPKGPVSIVSAPWTHILFEDISTVEGTGEWYINYGERNPTDWEPIGEDVPLVADENGNYNYFVEGPKTDFYRAPILKYGDKKYRLSDMSVGGLTDYCNSGIQATYSRVAMSLFNIKYGNHWYDFADGSRYGGKSQGITYPLAMTNMFPDEKSNIDLFCDGNKSTYFGKFGWIVAGDRWIVDCGDTIPRGKITITFIDNEHILDGTASILLGNDVYNMEEIGQYAKEDVGDGNVYTIDAGGKAARFIEFRALTVNTDMCNAYISEIEEENMHVFSVSGKTLKTYPAPSTDMGTYENNIINNLSDNNPSTIYWSSAPQNTDNYVLVDCGEVAVRNNIKMVFCDGDKPSKAALEISSDGETWESLLEFAADELTAENEYTIVSDAGGKEARYVRLRFLEPSAQWFKMADFIIEGARVFTEELEAKPICERLLTYYPKPKDPFYLDLVTMFACSYDNSNKILPVGQELKMAVVELKDDFSFGDTLGLSKITVSDIIRKPFTFANGGPASYVLDWRFYNDPEGGIGIPEQTGILIDSPFVIMIYDMDKIPGLNLAMLFGYKDTNHDVYGEAKFKYRDGDERDAGGGFSYWWNIFGSYKTLRADELCQTMNVGSEGGNASYKDEKGSLVTEGVFYSYLDMSDDVVKVETPDWLTCEFGETVDGRSTFTVKADASSEDREGEIVVSTDLVSAKIKVVQKGEVGIGSEYEDLVSVVRNGSSVTVQYPSEYTRMSVYSTNGTLVADYELGDGGVAEIAESDLNGNGVYVIKLEGEAAPFVTKFIW